MPDQDTEEEKCQMAFDEAQDAGETCQDCCATVSIPRPKLG